MKKSLIFVLRALKQMNLFPDLMNEIDESLIFEFFPSEEKYFLIEIYNTGTIILLSRNNSYKLVEEITPSQLEDSHEKLSEFIRRINET